MWTRRPFGPNRMSVGTYGNEEWMKHRVTAAALLLIVVSFLQTSVMGFVEIDNIRPLLPLAMAVTIALMRSPFESALMGLLLGLNMDVLLGRTIGWNGLLYAGFSFAIASVSDKMYRDRVIVRMGFTLAAAIMSETLYLLIIFLLRGYENVPWLMTHVVLPESAYTCVAVIPLFWPVRALYRWLDARDRLRNRI